MDTPVRKYQKQKDYQRHKLFRKMKRRRRAAIEQAKDAPMKQLRRKLKIPKFEDGKDDKPNVFQLADGTFVNSHNEPLDVLDYAGVEDPTKWTYVDKKGNRYTPKATRTLTEGEQFTQRQIENEQNTRPFEFTPYIEGANEGAAAASLMMGFPFNMAGSAYYGAKASRDAYNRNYLGAALNGLGAVTPAGSGIYDRIKLAIENYRQPLKKLESPVIRTVQDNGKIRLSLPTHTDSNPRQFVLEPQGDNKFYVHMRTWDGDHVPANLSNEDKQTLFQALYDELPDGAEILFPKSGPGYYGTRGTVAGLQRLARDPRFTPGTKGTLQYLDKDGKTVRIYEGTSFIKTPRITAENAASITPEQWTAAQDAAIARGDAAEAQRLRDLHQSLTPTATSGKYYRGTKIKRNSYPDRHIDEEVGEMNGIYLTKKPKYAKTYGDVEEFYLRSNNPLETEGSWTGIIDDATRAEIENAGYDAVVNNRFDTGFLNKLLRNSRDETITFNGKNLKSADAVTYADDGTRIPLGSRDNFNVNDIRYDIPFINSLRSIAADTKKKQIISYLENAEPVPRDILRRPLSSLDEDGKVQRSVANGVNDAVKFLRSDGYKTRLKNLGYTNDEANYIIDNQIDNIRKADVVTLPKYNKMYSRHGMATPYRRKDGTMGYQIALQPEKSLAYNPRVTAAHEAFHVGSNRHGIKDFTSLPQDIREHNTSIRPIVNDDYDAKLVFERLNDEELRARALEVLARSERANMPVMDYINKWGADPIPGKGLGILRNPNYDHNANELRTYFTPESLKRYLEGVAGIAAPLAGGTALLGYNSLGQPMDTYKHGKDSGIHINPKNRGKFNALKKRTGKTTEQLTHSKNPLTRKRAIFAQNAKKWKH